MRLRYAKILPPLLLALGLAPALPRLALAQSTSLSWQCLTPSERPPSGAQCPVNEDTPLPVSATLTPSGTQDVNITKVGGNAVTTTVPVSGTVTGNQGTPNAGGATNSWPVQGAGTAGTPAGGVVSVQGVSGGTVIPVAPTPSSASTSGIAAVFSSAVETGHVIKASAGNLYSLSVTADSTLSAAAWAIMVFNSTTVPAAGAVTPAWCLLLPSGATGYTGAFTVPMYLGTGISIAASSGQTCFTKTDSAHAFISAMAQ